MKHLHTYSILYFLSVEENLLEARICVFQSEKRSALICAIIIMVPNLAIVRIVTKVHLESCRALRPYSLPVVGPPCVSWRSNAHAASRRSADSPAIPSSAVAPDLPDTLANVSL